MTTRIKFVQFVNTVAFGSQIQSFSDNPRSGNDQREIALDDKQRFLELRRKNARGTWDECIVPMSNVASFIPLEVEEPKKAEEKKK